MSEDKAENKSEVARLLKQIDLAFEAAQLGIYPVWLRALPGTIVSKPNWSRWEYLRRYWQPMLA